jgi:hypothetical protein
MNEVIPPIKNLLRETDMTFDEVRAFEIGIAKLSIDEQVEMYRFLNFDRNLIYPTFVNFMAKKRAKETGLGWEAAVEAELKFLDSYIEGKRVGDEVKI